jgi:hypothetical protein
MKKLTFIINLCCILTVLFAVFLFEAPVFKHLKEQSFFLYYFNAIFSTLVFQFLLIVSLVKFNIVEI